MARYRVHASPIGVEGDQTPYLTLEAMPEQKVRLGFQSLVKAGDEEEPAVIMPMSSLYELLEGKDIEVKVGAAEVKLAPRRKEIIIDCSESMTHNSRQFRVSLSELAFAWNMIKDSGRDKRQADEH